MSGHLNRASRFTLVLGMAIGLGFAVTMGAALVGHELLVRLYGEEGIAAIDDTQPMFVAVLVAYVAGFLAGLVVLITGWRRLLRRTAGWAARHVLPGDSCGLVWTVRGLRASNMGLLRSRLLSPFVPRGRIFPTRVASRRK